MNQQQDTPMRVRMHKGFGHGLKPGHDSDINCLSCKREQKEGKRPVITVGGSGPIQEMAS